MKHNTVICSAEKQQEAFIFDIGSLYLYLESIHDRSNPRGVRYPLVVILVFTLLAKLAGEDHPRGIAHWVLLRKDLLFATALHEKTIAPHCRINLS